MNKPTYLCTDIVKTLFGIILSASAFTMNLENVILEAINLYSSLLEGWHHGSGVKVASCACTACGALACGRSSLCTALRQVHKDDSETAKKMRR